MNPVTPERRIATLDTNGQLLIPPEMQTALGLHPGSQVQISIRDHHLILQPVSTDLQPVSTDLVDQLYGIFAGQPSLEDDLYRDLDIDKW